jgi:energy-coupling factor transporter transmembrane protein EcfT
MDLTQIIIIIIAISVALIVFKLLARIIFKVILPILVLLIGGYFVYHYYGPGNLIEDITELYCEGNDVDEVKCECFVKPIISDLESRLSVEDIIKLKNNPLKSTEEFHISYKNKQEEINSCFESKGEAKSMADDIFKDIKELLSNFGNK